MNANRLWMIGGAIVAIAIVVLAWVVGISPQLDQARAADGQKISAQGQLEQTQLQLAKLKKDYDSIDQLQAQLAALEASVPSTDRVTDFVRQLAGQASATSVSVTAITIGEPTAYVPTASAAPSPSSTPTATPAPTASAAPTTVPTPNPTASAVAPPLGTDPLITGANFVMLPVSLTAQGDYPDLLSFTSALQNQGPRLFLVSTIDVKSAGGQQGSDGPAADTATLSGFIYVLVGS